MDSLSFWFMKVVLHRENNDFHAIFALFSCYLLIFVSIPFLYGDFLFGLVKLCFHCLTKRLLSILLVSNIYIYIEI